MFNIVLRFFSLLTKKQKRNFFLLQFLALLMAIIEILGLASVFPFITLVGDIDQLQQDTIFGKIYKASGIKSELQFLFFLGLSVLLILVLSSIISMLTIWKLSLFSTRTGAEIADRLYSYYLKKSLLFHTSGNTAELIKKIALEAPRATTGILLPLMKLISRLVIVIILSLTIFMIDPKVAFIGFFVFATAYYILFRLVRMRLQRNGKNISKVNGKRYRLMNEAFGGIKDILLMNRSSNFISLFSEKGSTLAYSQGANSALKQIPRYFMELIAFSSMILLILYLIINHQGNISIIIPILTIYALASLKLLPAFQQIYSSIATIKGNVAAFKSIEKDLLASRTYKHQSVKQNQNQKFLDIETKIDLKNVTFNYPNKKPILKNINISIPAKNVIGIVGPTGSGKSTIIDILLGLIEPKEGHLIVNDLIIKEENRREWQNSIGYVGQNIFLSQNSVAENIAFGISKDLIDFERVHQALELAKMSEEVKTFEKNIHTSVGERGLQLSGGQRQRIGIARALYHNPAVLIFDEATSSLDGSTEKKIMNTIYSLRNDKTIILISHRIKTLKECDYIFFIKDGQITDRGVYNELFQSNTNFINMVELT